MKVTRPWFLVRAYGPAAITIFSLPVAAWQRASRPSSWACTISTWKSRGSLLLSMFCIAMHSWVVCSGVNFSCFGAVVLALSFLSCLVCDGMLGGKGTWARSWALSQDFHFGCHSWKHSWSTTAWTKQKLCISFAHRQFTLARTSSVYPLVVSGVQQYMSLVESSSTPPLDWNATASLP